MSKQLFNALIFLAAFFMVGYIIFELQKREHKHQTAMADKAIEAEKIKHDQVVKTENRKTWGGVMQTVTKLLPFLQDVFA